MNAPFPWLAPQWRQFESWRAAGHMPHAILLSGPAGWGKARLALAMATNLLGLPSAAALPAADEAGGDAGAERPEHPDMRWVEADLDGGSRQIKIEQIRDFAAFAALTSFSGVKVGVIDEAERMNVNAASALLKTLEEPAAPTHIILVCHRPAALLATLRSRCQVLSVTPSAIQAHDWLAATVGMTAALEGLLWLAGNAPLRALALQRDNGGAASLAALALLPRLAVGAASLAPTLTAALAADPLLLLDGWLRALHDAAVGNVIPVAAGSWTRRAAPADMRPFTDVLLQAKRHVLSTSNPNMNWLFESLLLKWLAA